MSVKTAPEDSAIAPDGLKARLATLPIDQLVESPDNPRKHFDEGALEQLEESIRAHGILTPLRVREIDGGPHVIAAGHRRYRAARRIGRFDVPVLIGPMTDAEFLEILTIDNLQRDDLHPLEEARGFALLMERIGYDIARVASRIGKSKDYVYDSIRLLKLTKPAQEFFEAGKILKAHAVILSRLSPTEQERTIGTPKRMFSDGGLFERQHVDRTPEQEAVDKALGIDFDYKANSPRELQTWVDRHVRLNPKASDLPELFPAAAAMITEAVAVEEKVVHITYDYVAAHDAKDPKVRTFGSASWKRADGNAGSKKCNFPVLGLVVAGAGRGTAFHVCIDKKKCSVHWRAEKAAATRAKKRRESATPGKKPSWQLEQERAQARHEQQRREADRWKKAAPAMMEALEAAIAAAPSGPGTLIAELVIEECRDYRERPKKGDAPKALLSSDEILRECARNIVRTQLGHEWSLQHEAPPLLKKFGLDAKSIVDRVAPKAAESAAEKLKGKAAKPASKKKAVAKSVKKPTKKAAKRDPAATASETARLPLTEQQLNDDHNCERCGCTVDDACEGGCSWDMAFAKVGRAVCSKCAPNVRKLESPPPAAPLPATKPAKRLAGDVRREQAAKKAKARA